LGWRVSREIGVVGGMSGVGEEFVLAGVVGVDG
jgi:hypothetical protein